MIAKGLVFSPCAFIQKPNPVAPRTDSGRIGKEATLAAIDARTGKETFHMTGGSRGVLSDDGILTVVGNGGLFRTSLDNMLRDAKTESRCVSSFGHWVDRKVTSRTPSVHCLVQPARR